ncbi:MAG TPA: B12-binding domain-containing radical SAM protein, partial [Azonexus sp.]
AARYFSANKEQLEKAKREFALHPRQPLGLKPFLSPDLLIDNIVSNSPVKLTRRDAKKLLVPVVEEGAACCTPPAWQGAV